MHFIQNIYDRLVVDVDEKLSDSCAEGGKRDIECSSFDRILQILVQTIRTLHFSFSNSFWYLFDYNEFKNLNAFYSKSNSILNDQLL